MKTWRTALAAAALLTAASPLVALGESNPAATRLEAMAVLLADTPNIAVSVDCAYDSIHASGEKLEFGERRDVTLRRPDRARVDVTERDGSQRGIVFDGKQLAVFDAGDKVYATVEKPGSVDAALEYYAQRLRMRVPLRELFAADLPRKLKDALPSARMIGSETVGSTPTDHVWFRLGDADVQAWIARGERPLPERIVITYRRAEGQPQFRADFRNWRFEPAAADAVFVFTPPAGAEKIPILAPGQRRENGGTKP